jgi:outer membrane lipoprotein SlyB
LYRGTAMLCAAVVLSACVTTQAGRIGADDGTDSCRPQLVALDSTGNFFAEDILKGAAVGAGAGALGGAAVGGLASGNWRGALIGAAVGAAAGAAVGAAAGYYNALQQQGRDQAGLFSQVKGDLRNENAQLDRTQIAFDRLRDCRAGQARQIQADLRSGRISRPQAENAMAQVRSRSQRDVQLARTINGQIGGRSEQFEVAADKLSPGAQGAIRSAKFQPRSSTLTTNTALRSSPTSNAPELTNVAARESVTVKNTRDGFALVETSSGQTGYVPVSAVSGLRSVPVQPAVARGGSADETEVRTLAASNAAKRDNFEASIAVAERASTSGFELAS